MDGEFAADGFTSYNELNIYMTLNVTTANHTLRIAKMNDGSKGEAVLQKISISPNGRSVWRQEGRNSTLTPPLRLTSEIGQSAPSMYTKPWQFAEKEAYTL